MQTLEIIQNYMDLLENQLGMDIIIYDECRLLPATELSRLSQTGKWHVNSYCLKIKENKDLQRRCVNLKQDFVNKVLAGSGVVKSTCYCGVTEYVAPIKCGDYLVCMVAASGYIGDLHDCTLRALAKRVGLTYEKFKSIRGGALSEAENEQNIIRSIEILHHLLERYVLEETKIPEMLDERRRKTNEYVNMATEYISKNFLIPIDSQDVAKHCHISESHLKHLFSAAVGHGIAEEIRDLRLNYAKELLCTTEYSVKYISFASCFASSDYFSTVFKKKFKISPLEYRRYGKIKR